MAHYGREYRRERGGYDAGYGRGRYDAGDFRRWGEAGRRDGYDRGYGEGWGMEGLYHHMMHGPAAGGRSGHGRDHGRPFGQIAVGQPRHLGGGGRRRFTGMESNRQRGVYGSDFRVGYGGDDARYTGGPGREETRGGSRRPGWWG